MTDYVTITGQTPEVKNDGQTIIDVVHTYVHRGIYFIVSHLFENIANDGTATILIMTGDLDVQIQSAFAATGEATTTLYEDATASNSGTPIEVFNLFRRHSRAARTRVYHTPTISEAGTAIFSGLIPAGSGPLAGGALIRQNTEWILKPNTTYYLLLTNVSGQAQDYATSCEFYELDQAIE